jgi:hypothetical protein
VDPFVAESLFQLSIPVRRRFLRDHILEAGLRVGAFGPRFDSPEFALSNWNAVGFVAIAFNAAWGRQRAR